MSIIYPKIIIIEGGDVQNSAALLKERTLQIDIAERNVTVLRGKSYIVLDFGREIAGGVRILTYHFQGERRVRLRFGESLSEACAEIGQKNATNDHSLRDMTVELPEYSDMTFGNTGFRFLRIDTLHGSDLLKLKAVVSVASIDQRDEVGEFECDDELVNDIWRTAAYTLRLCMQNGFILDGIKRDRLVWIGDLYPEMKAAYSLFSDVPEVESCLAFAREQTPLPAWINNIPMYSMWWLINLSENYLYKGNSAFTEAQLPYAEGLIELFEKYVDDNGDTSFEYNFIDWPTHFEEGDDLDKKYDEYAGVNYLLRIALKKTAALLDVFGKNTEKCRTLIEKLCKKKYNIKKYKQIAALGILAGENDDTNIHKVLAGGGCGMSTFMSYVILTALSQKGEHVRALDIMKEYYGGMLSLNATTFWEDFDLDWMKGSCRLDELPEHGQRDIHGDFGMFCYKGFRHSFCHGWAAGVIGYMSENILGVKVLDVGTKKVRIQPHLSGLKRVKGAFPTPYGLIKMDIRQGENGELEKNIELPDGIELVE